MMPMLAEHYTVISVHLRGMGSSSKPADGYDKKTMAKDIYDLVRSLGYENAIVAGHDIGPELGSASGSNFPPGRQQPVMISRPHPQPPHLSLPSLPPPSSFPHKRHLPPPYLSTLY